MARHRVRDSGAISGNTLKCRSIARHRLPLDSLAACTETILARPGVRLELSRVRAAAKRRYAVTCCDGCCERRSEPCFTVQVHPISAGLVCGAARNGRATERGVEEPVKAAAANRAPNQRNN